MKKFAVIVLCFMMVLCACSGKKSAEAIKADELIQSIGSVDVEGESVIKAARIYYDTLTEAQKNEVESYPTLLEAERKLDQILAEKAAEEQARKEAEEQARQEAEKNAQIYAKAVEYDEQNMIDKAYEQYALLPDDYEDVQARMEVIAPYVGICGAWVCDVQLAKAKNGKEWRPLFSQLTISIDKRTSNTIVFKYEGRVTTVDRNHMLFNKIDMWAALSHDKGWFYNCTVQKDGSRVFDESEALGSTEMGSLREQFTFLNVDKMEMSARIKKHNIDVTFPYTKSN